MEETQPDNSVKTFHVVSDAGGNVTNLIESHADGSLTMANSYEYGPFGQVIAKTEAVEMPYQFNTKMVDSETGLNYYGYRFYNSADGRWLNRDPIGVNGGINIYNSVSNNMVNGFSGGLSHSGGMNADLGDLLESFQLDSYGLASKVKFTPGNIKNTSPFVIKANKKSPKGLKGNACWFGTIVVSTGIDYRSQGTNAKTIKDNIEKGWSLIKKDRESFAIIEVTNKNKKKEYGIIRLQFRLGIKSTR